MVAFIIGGDFDFTGLTTLSGGINLTSISSATSLELDAITLLIGNTLAADIEIGSLTAGINVNGTGINITANSGFLVLQGNNGSSYVDNVGIAFDAPDFNLARNTALTMVLGNSSCVSNMFFDSLNLSCSSTALLIASTSLRIDSPTVTLANAVCTSLNAGAIATVWTITGSTYSANLGGNVDIESATGFIYLQSGDPLGTYSSLDLDPDGSWSIISNGAGARVYTSGGSIDLNTIVGTSDIKIGASGINTTIIQNTLVMPNLQAAIAGSVPVLWDPVTQQFSHT